jgi:hypothetical protein
MHTDLDHVLVITNTDLQRLLPILEQSDTPASDRKRCVNPTWQRRARPPRLPRCESHPSEAS